jgi:hypothetical protein
MMAIFAPPKRVNNLEGLTMAPTRCSPQCNMMPAIDPRN